MRGSGLGGASKHQKASKYLFFLFWPGFFLSCLSAYSDSGLLCLCQHLMLGFWGGQDLSPRRGSAVATCLAPLLATRVLTLCEQCRNSVRLMAFEFLPTCRCGCHSLQCLQPWLFIWKRFVTVPRALLSGGFLQDFLQLSQVLFPTDGPREGQGKLQLVFVSATAAAFAGAPVR